MESLVAQRIKSVLESKQISIAAFSKMIGMQQVLVIAKFVVTKRYHLVLLRDF